jgi:general secretion pathway protein I
LSPKKPSEPRQAPVAPRGASRNAQAGFTLIEALVALAVVAVCLSAIGTLMAQNSRAVRQIDQRVALVSVLRKVLAALPDRPDLAGSNLAGEMAGHQWAVSAAPYADPEPPAPGKRPPEWMPQSIVIKARAPSGSLFEVETLRLVPRPKAPK